MLRIKLNSYQEEFGKMNDESFLYVIRFECILLSQQIVEVRIDELLKCSCQHENVGKWRY